MEIITVTAVLVALAAATRGVWSPCGLSMLTSINPVSERGRNHRFGVTAGWFIIGGVLGGATLGLGAAILALVVRSTGIGLEARLATGAALAVLATLLDLGILGVTLAGLAREVHTQGHQLNTHGHRIDQLEKRVELTAEVHTRALEKGLTGVAERLEKSIAASLGELLRNADKDRRDLFHAIDRKAQVWGPTEAC